MESKEDLIRQYTVWKHIHTVETAFSDLPADPQDREKAYKRKLDDLIQMMAERKRSRTVWDFSAEKKQQVFAQNDSIVIRPINSGDAKYYGSIRAQYSNPIRSLFDAGQSAWHFEESLFLLDVCGAEAFYCIIMDAKANTPVGYIGIKDSSSDLWEIAIELDRLFTHRGYGCQSIRLFLNEINRITGKTEFQARIRPENIPSQKCFEKLGAKLTGLCDAAPLKTTETPNLEEEDSLLFDSQINELAERLGVAPQKLHRHFLDYRMTCPL